jgi:hypothetical protein
MRAGKNEVGVGAADDDDVGFAGGRRHCVKLSGELILRQGKNSRHLLS